MDAKTTEALRTWSTRVAQLEPLLRKHGRENLVILAVNPIRRLLERIERRADLTMEDAVPLLERALLEVRSCVTNPAHSPDIDAFERIDVLARHGREGPPAPAQNAVAADLVSSLAEGDDSELVALLGAVDAALVEPQQTRDELGTLREPLGGGQSDQEKRVLMKGELQAGLLCDLIQLFAQNQETGQLVLEHEGERSALYFAAGQIVDAESGGLSGEAGFFNLMQVQRGRFSYQRGVKAEQVRIHRRAQHLIMDTLRMIDEAS